MGLCQGKAKETAMERVHPDLEPHTSHSPRPPLASSDGAEGGWLRPQAEEDLIQAAREGDLATLKRLVAEGMNLEAADEVGAAPRAARSPLVRHLAHPPRRTPARRCPTLTAAGPLTACGAAAAPPQYGFTALMKATYYGKLDCLEHLVARGASLEATTTT